eukprot:TRINITY_DN45633_c0_g1_i1.p1 TRINITY_DN45633_c0_g1~~TRINITY_DN45633_c0_g1_i1.p1  ORF type:complete len:259 (+),score=76.28 TRINITY_DN45633_c0_g1_i1:3-779(+)
MIGSMRQQLSTMTDVHSGMMQPRKEEDARDVSPPRYTAGVQNPATLADTRAQDDTHHYLHLLHQQHSDLQRESQDAMDAMHKLHKKEVQDIKAMHAERLGMIVSEQDDQLQTQQVLAKRLMETQKAELLRNQLELLRKQQGKLADLTRVVRPVQQRVTPDPAKYETPPVVKSMSDALSKLRTINARPFESGMVHQPLVVQGMQDALRRMQDTQAAAPLRSDVESPWLQPPYGYREPSVQSGYKQVSPMRSRVEPRDFR